MFLLTMLATRTLADGTQEVQSGLANKIAEFFDFIIGQIPNWIGGFLVFVLTIFIAKLAKSAVESRIGSQIDEEHQEVLVLSGRVTYFGTLALGITIALKIAGIDLTTILAAVAFGIGFALQDLIMNFLAGVMILVSRQFTIGDFIKVGNTLGKVMEIQSRATILKATDGTKVIVPNAEIFTSQVTSYTTNPLRRVTIPLSVSYDTDLKYAMKIIHEVLKSHPKVLKKPGATVVVGEYGDYTIDLSARFWVGSRDGWVKVKSDLMVKFMKAFNDAGIVVPYKVIHVETNQDTAEEYKKAAETAKKKRDEMNLSKALEEEAHEKKPSENGTAPVVLPAVAATNGTTAVVAPGQAALATVPVTPEAAFLDQEEIDGQA